MAISPPHVPTIWWTSAHCWWVRGTPANFNGFRALASLLQLPRSMEANKTLHDVGCLLHWYTIYTFWGSSPITEFCHVQNSRCVQVLRSPILAALMHGTRAVGVSESLWHRTRNGITELSQRAPPIFIRAAITLGIGPHSSSSKMGVFTRIAANSTPRFTLTDVTQAQWTCHQSIRSFHFT